MRPAASSAAGPIGTTRDTRPLLGYRNPHNRGSRNSLQELLPVLRFQAQLRIGDHVKSVRADDLGGLHLETIPELWQPPLHGPLNQMRIAGVREHFASRACVYGGEQYALGELRQMVEDVVQ